MSKYDVNIIGEPFLKYVGDQINVRQAIQGSGLTEKSRTAQQIQYLNGRNSWIKVASSVKIEDIARLTNIGFSESQAKSLKGTGLAKEFVLFNGSSNATKPLQRFGVSKKDNLTTGNNYGTAGSDDFGLQAMPGITSFSVAHNNLGSIRTGEITIRANSRRQFDILELLYIRLGYTILVEWGNGIFFDNNNQFQAMGQTLVDDLNKGWFNQEETTHLEFYGQINKIKEQYQGNYDAFFCKVNNFDWSFNPDGYYEIKLSLVSLGDVVESLRINSLTKTNTIPETTPVQQQANKSDLFNFLYCKKQFLEQGQEQLNQSKNYVSVSKVVGNDIVAAQTRAPGLAGPAALNVVPSKKNYVRLGTFLQWLEKNIIPFYEYGDKSEPMLAINTTSNNYMRNFPGLISTDTDVCFMRNNLVYDEYGELIGDVPKTKTIFEKFLLITEDQKTEVQDPLLSGDFTGSPGSNVVGPRNATTTSNFTDDYVGRIMNIYLNFDFIEQTLKSKKDALLNQNIFSFVKSLCDGINSCFGGYIDLEPIIQNEKILVIVDRNLNARVDREGKVLDDSQKSPTINMFGYDLANSTSNFVKNFSFNTKISKDLASMIAIGATANNQSNLETSNFFNNLNRGLVDRFAQKLRDGEKEDKKTEEEKLECATGKKQTPSKNNKYRIKYVQGPLVGAFFEQIPEEEIKEIEDRKKEDDTDYEPVLEDFWFNYVKYLREQFGTESSTEFDASKYFISNDEANAKGSSLLSNYIREYIKTIQYQTKDTTSLQSSMIGFIPIDINVTLDGIGGIRIYNQLVVDGKFLPQGYPDKVEFIVKGVQHQIQDNDWTTVISAVSKPSPKTSFDVSLEAQSESLSAKPSTESAEIDEDIKFFPPLATIFPVIRNDAGGSGYFGASRDSGGRTHNGVDYRTRDNEIIYAPITGVIKPSKATKASRLPGVKIIGTGIYSGITVFIFYARPTTTLLGQVVRKGAPIAKAVNLQKSRGGDYPENVTNHIHFAIKKGDIPVNPQSVEYKLDT